MHHALIVTDNPQVPVCVVSQYTRCLIPAIGEHLLNNRRLEAISSRSSAECKNTLGQTHVLTDFLDLTALLGFERRQSANKGLPLGSVKDHNMAALVVLRPAQLRPCLIESAYLVLGRPLVIFQPWMFGLKS